jgi:uncharacterized protein involved in exopolysaccharide biosynthesis
MENEEMNKCSPSQQRTAPPEGEEFSLLDYWRVLLKWKWMIGLFVGATFVGSIVISGFLPKIYASTVTLLPPIQEGPPGMGAMASQFSGNLGGLAGSLFGTKSPSDLWVAILKSRTVQDAIVARFNLTQLFGVETTEEARILLNQKVKILKSKEDIISITVEDENPKQTVEIANAYVEELDRVNKNIMMSAGGRMRVFVEKRLAEQKTELSKIEEEVRRFQEQNGAVKLDDQSKAIIDAFGTVKGQLMAKEVELQTFLSYATPNNPHAQILQAQIEELKQRLAELEEGGKGRPKSIFIPTAKIPDLALKYARLLRDAKVQETVYGLLNQQYEMSRIQEAKDSPTVQILDAPKVPEKKVKPKRKYIVLSSTFGAMVGGICLSFVMEAFQNARLTRRERRQRMSGGIPAFNIRGEIQGADLRND